MSRNVRMIAQLRLESQVRQLMGMFSSDILCNSAELRGLAADLSTSQQVTNEALRVLTDPGLGELARRAGVGERLNALLDDLDVTGLGSSPAPGHAAAGLLDELGSHLAGLERSALTALAVDTLGDLGYTVRSEHGDYADGIEAWTGDEVVLLALTDGGEIISDQAGAGGACAERLAAFEAGMARRGATLSRTGVDAHGRPTGPLIAAAAASGEASLALAIARNAVPGPSPAFAAKHRPSATRSGSRQGPNQGTRIQLGASQ